MHQHGPGARQRHCSNVPASCYACLSGGAPSPPQAEMGDGTAANLLTQMARLPGTRTHDLAVSSSPPAPVKEKDSLLSPVQRQVAAGYHAAGVPPE